MRIGDSRKRSISGGEKRPVSIACELVKNPSILFLDEPTSVSILAHASTEGVLMITHRSDAYNAFNVVENLTSLARDYSRTVICTIHQPRSNIVALFDQLLLYQGNLVYSGEMSKCRHYFASIDRLCRQGLTLRILSTISFS